MTTSKNTLGLYTNPAGCCAKQVDVLCDNMQSWTDRLCSSRLPTKWGWTSYRRQLWPKLAYGLGTNAATIEEIVGLEDEKGDRPAREDDDAKIKRRKLSLRAIVRRMLPKLGVNRNVKRGWRHLGQLYGSIGLRKLFPEIPIARINLFLQHYRSPSSVGTSLVASMKHLQLEVGFINCPLDRPYHPLGPLTTRC